MAEKLKVFFLFYVVLPASATKFYPVCEPAEGSSGVCSTDHTHSFSTLTTFLETASTSNPLYCAALCDREELCKFYAFDKVAGKCVLLDRYFECDQVETEAVSCLYIKAKVSQQ